MAGFSPSVSERHQLLYLRTGTGTPGTLSTVRTASTPAAKWTAALALLGADAAARKATLIPFIDFGELSQSPENYPERIAGASTVNQVPAASTIEPHDILFPLRRGNTRINTITELQGGEDILAALYVTSNLTGDISDLIESSTEASLLFVVGQVSGVPADDLSAGSSSMVRLTIAPSENRVWADEDT